MTWTVRTAIERCAEEYGDRHNRARCAIEALGAAADLVLEDFGPRRFKQFWRSRDWSSSYANVMKRVILQAFEYAVSEEVIDSGSLERLRCVKLPPMRGKKDVLPVAMGDVLATLPYLREDIADVATLQMLTCSRGGEIIGIRRCEIDATDATCWVVRPTEHKNAWRGKPKAIAIGPRGIAIVQKYLDGPPETVPMAHECDYRCRIFRRLARLARPSNSYAEAIARTCRKHEIPHWHPHQLRHLKATEIDQAFGREAFSAVTGNSLDMASVYVERDLELAKKVARAIG